MHDLLASEYDMGNVVVTKMKNKMAKTKEPRIEEHERTSSPNERNQTHLVDGVGALREESPNTRARH